MIPRLADYLGRRGAFAARLCLLWLGMLVTGACWWEWPARPYTTLPLEGACLYLRASQDGSSLLVVQTDRITLWDLAQQTKRGGCTFPEPPDFGMFTSVHLQRRMEQLWLSADGRKVAFAFENEKSVHPPTYHVRLLNVDLSNSSVDLADCGGDLSRTAPDSPVLVTEGEVGYRLWDLSTGQELYRGQVTRGDVQDVCALPDGRVLVVRELRKFGWLWDEAELLISDPNRGSPTVCLSGVSGPAKVIADGSRLVATRGSSMLLFDLQTQRLIQEFKPETGVNSIRYEQQRLLALSPPLPSAPGADRPSYHIHVWNLAGDPPALYGPFTRDDAPWPALSPDTRWAAFWHRSDPSKSWWHGELVDLRSRQLAGQINDRLVSPLTFSPDGRYLTAYTERPLSPSFWLRWQRLRNIGVAPWDESTYSAKVWRVPDCRELGSFDDKLLLAWIGENEVAVAGAASERDIELWHLPPRRSPLVDYGFPVLFGLLLVLLMRSILQFRSTREN